MKAIACDTLKFVEKLIAAGVPEKQAKAEAEALSEVLTNEMSDLVTKADLQTTKSDLKSELENLENRLEARLVKWIVGISFAQMALIVALIKLTR